MIDILLVKLDDFIFHGENKRKMHLVFFDKSTIWMIEIAI